MAKDDFQYDSVASLKPIENGFSVTPHNTNELTKTTRAIWVGAAGDLEVVTKGGDTIILVGVAAGTLVPIRATIVKAANTTADSIVGLY